METGTPKQNKAKNNDFKAADHGKEYLFGK